MAEYKKDIILISFVLLIIISLFTVSFTIGDPGKSTNGKKNAAIYINGELYEKIDLNEDKEIRIDTAKGYNIISVKNGEISVTGADCPGGTCINTGAIHENGSFIACLPHELFIRVETDDHDKEDELDAVAY
ncbi:MAG: NusG domain II-containing protein [Lachnospiraceae bacterium]|nr:NusG domain II-containing protein [Lachnospiraceae bacterium]